MERPEAWVEALCRTEGLDPGSLVRYPGGSTPVYAAGDRVLKLYPPTHLEEHAAETAVLTAVPDRLPVLVPRLQVSGRWDAWGFVVMDRLDGVRLKDVWPAVARRGPARAGGPDRGAGGRAARRTPPDVAGGRACVRGRAARERGGPAPVVGPGRGVADRAVRVPRRRRAARGAAGPPPLRPAAGEPAGAAWRGRSVEHLRRVRLRAGAAGSAGVRLRRARGVPGGG